MAGSQTRWQSTSQYGKVHQAKFTEGNEELSRSLPFGQSLFQDSTSYLCFQDKRQNLRGGYSSYPREESHPLGAEMSSSSQHGEEKQKMRLSIAKFSSPEEHGQ